MVIADAGQPFSLCVEAVVPSLALQGGDRAEGAEMTGAALAGILKSWPLPFALFPS